MSVINETPHVALPDIAKQVHAMTISDDPEVLADIYHAEYNIAVWNRAVSPSLTSKILNDLSGKTIAISRVIQAEHALATMREELCKFDCANELSEDIAELVDMFCCLFDLKRTGLRLSTLDRAMCPRFHVDNVPSRLITTYAGAQGTEWLPNSSVDRTKLGTGNNGLPDDQSGLYSQACDIQCLDIGQVALLKGERWEGNEGSGLVHRSPQIIAGETRLLLTLDFIS